MAGLKSPHIVFWAGTVRFAADAQIGLDDVADILD